MVDFSNQTVVVTGGLGALGSAVVERIVGAGGRCVVPTRGASRPSQSAQVEVIGGVDLTDDQSTQEFYSRVADLTASIHLAGGFSMAPCGDTRADDLRAAFEQNAMTCFLACREAIARMRARGRGGRIVNVSSRPALVPCPGMVAYAVAKGAVCSLTTSLAAEVAGDQILINAVIPSIFDTPQNRAAMPDSDPKRWPTPAQIAETICFFASSANALSSGALIPVYGTG